MALNPHSSQHGVRVNEFPQQIDRVIIEMPECGSLQEEEINRVSPDTGEIGTRSFVQQDSPTTAEAMTAVDGRSVRQPHEPAGALKGRGPPKYAYDEPGKPVIPNLGDTPPTGLDIRGGGT